MLVMSDEERRAINLMFQGQAIYLDNILSYCDNQASFKALTKIRGKANQVTNGSKGAKTKKQSVRGVNC